MLLDLTLLFSIVYVCNDSISIGFDKTTLPGEKKEVLPFIEEDFPSLITKKVKEESPSNEVTGAHYVTEEETVTPPTLRCWLL